MAKLIVNPTSSARREVPLSRTLMSIGRDPSNDVVLPDAMVSRRHAVIEYRGSQYFLRDCNSSNGSLVNGDRVSERTLRDGDLVAIGTARLLFRDEVTEEGSGKVVQHPSSPRLQCPACLADHRKGDLFCRQCGASLAPAAPPKAVCASCGTVVPLPARFCNACGTALPPEAAEPASPPPAAAAAEASSVAAEPPAPEPAPPAMEARVAAAAGATPAGGAPPETDAMAAAPPPSEPPVPQARVGEAPRARSAAVRPFVSPSARPGAPRPARVLPTDPIGSPPARGRRADDSVTRPTPAVKAEPGRLAPRAAAALVDLILVSAVQAVAVWPAVWYWRARQAGSDPAFAGVLLAVGGAAVAGIFGIAYYVYYWGVRGATPGKRLLGLAVQGEDGQEPVGATRAAVRLFGYLVSAALLGAGFVMVAFGGRGLHDRIAGTRVVRRGRD
jgi:pSer/pThr/pTyr-binding forkhead associated (FHA) protein/uncharacterized RDD family membrane protein YckC